MGIDDLSRPLDISDIDFRVQSINKGKYATILAYKDARADMNRLDQVVGKLNWKREHTRDNRNCIVSIWDHKKKEWISKEDTGTESREEQEKGLASDSFKRACFNWGIGRELYDYPTISVKLREGEYNQVGTKQNGDPNYKQTFMFNPNNWRWKIQFNDGILTYLSATDSENNLRFSFGKIEFLLASKEWVAALGKRVSIDEVKKYYKVSKEVEIEYLKALSK